MTLPLVSHDAGHVAPGSSLTPLAPAWAPVQSVVRFTLLSSEGGPKVGHTLSAVWMSAPELSSC
jgi:hypothetical protein